MKENQENEKKYDISKSNFFANIPDNNDNQQKNEINEAKNLSLDNINTPMPNSQNINNINNMAHPSYQDNYFPPQNYYNQYQYQNQW